jgi:hypothetical protein
MGSAVRLAPSFGVGKSLRLRDRFFLNGPPTSSPTVLTFSTPISTSFVSISFLCDYFWSVDSRRQQFTPQTAHIRHYVVKCLSHGSILHPCTSLMRHLNGSQPQHAWPTTSDAPHGTLPLLWAATPRNGLDRHIGLARCLCEKSV